jgi:RNA polymerase sigma-70 factor (ECF subfamily)
VTGAGFGAEEAAPWIPRLRRYALALTGTREAADDLTQDTLERAWRKRAQWRRGSDLRAWLFTVMHNVYVNGVRAARRVESLDTEPVAGEVRAMSGSASPDDHVVVSDLQAALLRLPDEQRAVVLLIGLEQLSYAEAAGVLDVPIGTVMSRLARGRERLRALLEGGVPAAAPLRRVK